MFLIIFSTLMKLYNCSFHEERKLSIITNCNLDEDETYDTLKFLAFNDFLVFIFREIEFKNGRKDELDVKFTEFLKRLFLSENNVAKDKILDYFKMINAKDHLRKIFYYVHDQFWVSNKDIQDTFISYNNIYYKFMGENQCRIKETRSLAYVCVIFYSIFTGLIDCYSVCETNIIINFHQINQIDISNSENIYTDSMYINDKIIYSLGFLIIPFLVRNA